MTYKTFEDMKVWQNAMDLAVKIFHLTENRMLVFGNTI